MNKTATLGEQFRIGFFSVGFEMNKKGKTLLEHACVVVFGTVAMPCGQIKE